MGKRMKMTVALGIAVTMVLSVVGCGNTVGSVGLEDGFTPKLDTDAELSISVVGEFGNFEALEQVANDFQQYYPNIEVVYTCLDDFDTDIKNRFATGKDIDLFMTEWLYFDDENRKYLWDECEDLSDIGIDFSGYNKNYLSYGSKDEKMYGFPIYLQNYGLMVNEDLLGACDLTVPESWEEFLDCCETLSEYGYPTPILTHQDLYGRCFVNRYMEDIIGGTEPEQAFEGTIEMAQNLDEYGYIHPDSFTLEDNYNAILMRFLEGDIPFATISLGRYSGIRKREAKSEKFTEKPFHYNFIPFPVTKEAESTYMSQLGMLFFCVYEKSEHLDYANEFMRFLTLKKHMADMAEIKNLPTALESTMNDFTYLKRAKKLYRTSEHELLMESAGTEGLNEYKLGAQDQSASFAAFQEYRQAE